MKKFKKPTQNQKGMTLIEIMIVVGIIAFLFTVIGQAVNRNRKKAQISQAKIGIGLIERSLLEFNYDCGYFPESLDSLVTPDSNCESWGPGPYFKNGKIPKDPWKNNFIYEFDQETSNYTIISLGADKRRGGEDFNKDISSAE